MSPSDYSIQVSDDGTTWRTVITRTNTRPSPTHEQLNTEARFLRMLTTKVGDGSGGR